MPQFLVLMHFTWPPTRNRRALLDFSQELPIRNLVECVLTQRGVSMKITIDKVSVRHLLVLLVGLALLVAVVKSDAAINIPALLGKLAK